MTKHDSIRPWRAVTVACAVLQAALILATPAAACEFATVKSAIDNVLDKDAGLAQKFRKEFGEGADPFTIIEQMVDAQTIKKIDVCRFQAAEYFTKRGFPPSH